MAREIVCQNDCQSARPVTPPVGEPQPELPSFGQQVIETDDGLGLFWIVVWIVVMVSAIVDGGR